MKPALSLCMPYYRNPRMLIRHLLVWKNEWSAEMKTDVEVVIVDDGSPDETASDAVAAMWNGDRTGLPPLSLYRVTEDRLWHQHGARNLGAHVATSDWLLMTDMDHIVPPSTVRAVLDRLPMRKRGILTFGRVDAPATLTWKAEDWRDFARTRRSDGTLKHHVNSFVVSRKYYWQLGGYDERLCGLYGTDMDFRRRLFGPRSTVTHLEDAPLIRVGREVIADASTRDVERKVSGRKERKKAVILSRIESGGGIKTLQFPWEQVL